MDYKIKNAEFITSIADIAVYKSNSGNYLCPEICVAGRSNVGKSSFINMLAGAKVAKTSSTPGRTRLLNLFSFNSGEFMLVDLPGYGYAEAAKTDKDKWNALIEDYFASSEKLCHVFALVDSRHEPSVLDKTMINYLYHEGLPFTVIATKTDKLSKSELLRNMVAISAALKIGRDNIIPVSAEKRYNKEKTEERIGQILENNKLKKESDNEPDNESDSELNQP